mmetsp:Transcript_11562/g.9161  ORF Transcript_11562/g.9161 Transcript_11562/m.9161 type:complete len:114 (-) Transcript_11562:242-583(-)
MCACEALIGHRRLVQPRAMEAATRGAEKDPTGSSTPKSPANGLKSALRKKSNGAVEDRPPRYDAHGNMISPKSMGGRSGHHMTFADQQSGKIEEVLEVKAWKNNQSGCGCIVA